jgi:hypothetical protein
MLKDDTFITFICKHFQPGTLANEKRQPLCLRPLPPNLCRLLLTGAGDRKPTHATRRDATRPDAPQASRSPSLYRSPHPGENALGATRAG